MAYVEAPARWKDVQVVIEKNMARVDTFGAKYDATLAATISALSRIRVDNVSAPSRLNTPGWNAGWVTTGNVPEYSDKSKINWKTEPDSTLDLGLGHLGLDDGDDAFAGLVQPAAPVLNIPEAPASAFVTKPQRPVVNTDIPFPDAPAVALPELGNLRDIDIPAFTFPVLPDFNGTAPDTNGLTVPNVFIDWVEPEYKPLLLNEIVARIREWLQGGSGIPPAVEAALFERARSREAIAAHKFEQEAADLWAARGFTLPPGALNSQILALREQERLRAGELNRDVWIESSKWEIENLRFTVQQGIALEQMWMDHFEEAARRGFDMARYHAEAQISLFNAQIGLFNAKAQTFQIQAEVWKTRLDAALAKLQAWKTAIEGQAVVAEINQQTVEVYKARLEAVKTGVALYSEKMRAALTRLDAAKVQVDLYRTDIQAYAEEIGADKSRFEAYSSRIQGETAKAGLYEAQSRAFAAMVNAVSSKQEVKLRRAQVFIEQAQARTQAFSSRWQAYSQMIGAQAEHARIDLEAYRAKVEGWRAQQQATVAVAEAQTRYADMATRTNIAYSEMQIKVYEAQMNKAVQEANVAVSSLQAAGQFSAQMAAGAMSAFHMGSTLDGAVRLSDATNTNITVKKE